MNELVRNYSERMYVHNKLENLNYAKHTFHARYRTRIWHFMKTKRRRFVYIIAVIAGLQIIENMLKVVGSRTERATKKYKKGIIKYFRPWLMTQPTAVDNNYQCLQLSRDTQNALGEKFVQLDSKFKYGVTKQMLYTCISNCGKMDEATEQKLLQTNPYLDRTKNLQSSLSLKQFYNIIAFWVDEDKITGVTDELLLLDLLMKELERVEGESHVLSY